MAKKKRSPKNTPETMNNNPFRALKGFAVSDAEDEALPAAEKIEPAVQAKERSFAEEMDFLGVDPLAEQRKPSDDTIEPTATPVEPAEEQSDEQLFMESLGQLDVHFSDQFPVEVQAAKPRRLKQLRQGRLIPDARLDLHGLRRHQVAGKISHFLQDAAYQQWQTLVIVTGRGLHSADGQAVLRDEAERYLAENGRRLVAEWGRAPRQYGGKGALVVFLKKQQKVTD